MIENEKKNWIATGWRDHDVDEYTLIEFDSTHNMYQDLLMSQGKTLLGVKMFQDLTYDEVTPLYDKFCGLT